MKSVSQLLIVGLVIYFSYLKEAQADECQDFVKKMMLGQMKFVVPCIEELGLTTPKEKNDKVFCIMKCVLKDAQWLGADGNVDFDLAGKQLESIPEKFKDKANSIITECGHHAASLDPNEATCNSYGPLLTCLTDIAIKMCEP